MAVPNCKESLTKEGLTVDEALPIIGEFGKFQIVLVMAFCVMKIPGSMAVLLPFFAQHDPGWKCAFNSTVCKLNGTITSSNKNDFEKRCNMPRSEWQFTQPKHYSVVTQFDVVCDMQPYNLLTTSLFFLCWGLGAAIFGRLSDRFGRKLILIPTTSGVMIIGLISAFAPNFAFFAVCRILMGFLHPGSFVQMFILVSEFVRPKHRPAALTYQFFQHQPLYTWFRRLLHSNLEAPDYCLWVPESARWLCLHGKAEEGMKVIKRIAKINGKDFPRDLTLIEVEKTSAKSSGNILNLFRPKKMAISSIIQGFACRSQKDHVSSVSIAGLACVAASIIPNDGTRPHLIPLRVCLGILGKFCISMSFDSIYTWSAELYPTVIRGVAMGYLQIAARLGSALAPWVARWLIGIHAVLPFSLMGGLAIIVAVLQLKLPETAFKPTAETFDDLDDVEDFRGDGDRVGKESQI
eukprot:gene10685-11821_t